MNQQLMARNIVAPIEKNLGMYCLMIHMSGLMSLGISSLVNKNIDVKDKEDESTFQTDCVLTYKDDSNVDPDDSVVNKNKNKIDRQKQRQNFQKVFFKINKVFDFESW